MLAGIVVLLLAATSSCGDFASDAHRRPTAAMHMPVEVTDTARHHWSAPRLSCIYASRPSLVDRPFRGDDLFEPGSQPKYAFGPNEGCDRSMSELDIMWYANSSKRQCESCSLGRIPPLMQ
jgi:hypothetical protein